MKTKQLIINQAIKLYNTRGITNVKSRDLAASLNMSKGNVDYHFSNKEVLLNAIYIQMRNDISIVYKGSDPSINPFINFNELLLALEVFQKKYSFFNLDILEISRNYPNVNIQVQKTRQIRRGQMNHFYMRFKEFGYLKEEAKPFTYLKLQHIIRVLITFWIPQEEILTYHSKEQNNNLANYIWELLIPHFTDKGFKIYNDLILEGYSTSL